MIRVLPYAAAAAHGLLCCWLAVSALPLWALLASGDAGAGLVLLVAGIVALLGLRTTLAVLLALGARAAAGLHIGSARVLAAAALRCSPRALRTALAGSLTGLVVTGSLASGALAVPAGTGPAAAAVQETAASPSSSPSPGWPVTEEPGPAPEHSPGWPVDPGADAPEDPGSGVPDAPEDPGPGEDRPDRPDSRPGAPPGDAPEAAEPRVVTVARGDSLWSIAAATEGTRDPAVLAAAVGAIHRENRAVIGADPNLILPGARLEIP